jgi:glycosyltransferase involved in cell wall biosynthesis
MKNPFFIDKNLNILSGDQAVDALKKENDNIFSINRLEGITKRIKQVLLPLYSIYDLRPVINYFNTNYKKNVLISYVVRPFRHGINLHHTNSAEGLIIAKIFNELGYNVDVVWIFSKKKIDFEKYDVIFGVGEPFERSFYYNKKHIKRICYCTGTSPSFNNLATINRAKEVFEKKGKLLLSSTRLLNYCWSLQFTLSDGLIVLGNKFVADTYKSSFTGNIININASFYKIFNYERVLQKKDFKSAQKHYLWFGGSGFIHKGVDLLLEVFRNRSDIFLHICGPLSAEPEFEAAYYEELYKTKNIHFYGFINIESEQFKYLLENCCFVIFPSCSEGGAASVINVMANGGLIPIVNRESSISIYDFGIDIDELNTDGIEKAINISQSFSVDELKFRSYKCGELINSRHTADNFYSSMKSAIETIIFNQK